MESSLPASKCTLVPSEFFDSASARETLSELVDINENEEVAFVEIPWYNAVLIYSISGESKSLPEMFFILKGLQDCREYNKILCTYDGSYLYMAIAQGSNLLLSNVFEAVDFTTAEYFIFLAMKNLQLNPEVSTICWRKPISEDEEMSLYRYFKAVEQPAE